MEPGLRERVLPYADWSEGRAQAQAVVEHDDSEFWSRGRSSPSVIVARVVKSPTVRQARSRARALFFTAGSLRALEGLAGSTYAGWESAAYWSGHLGPLQVVAQSDPQTWQTSSF